MISQRKGLRAKPCGQQQGWGLSAPFPTRGVSETPGLAGKGVVCAILFGEELGHSQVLGCFRLRQGEEGK